MLWHFIWLAHGFGPGIILDQSFSSLFNEPVNYVCATFRSNLQSITFQYFAATSPIQAAAVCHPSSFRCPLKSVPHFHCLYTFPMTRMRQCLLSVPQRVPLSLEKAGSSQRPRELAPAASVCSSCCSNYIHILVVFSKCKKTPMSKHGIFSCPLLHSSSKRLHSVPTFSSLKSWLKGPQATCRELWGKWSSYIQIGTHMGFWQM